MTWRDSFGNPEMLPLEAEEIQARPQLVITISTWKKPWVTQLGGDATYVSETGRELGPWPAPGRGGSALGMSTRVPRALQERAQHGSCQMLLPPVGWSLSPSLSVDFRELQGTGGGAGGGA